MRKKGVKERALREDQVGKKSNTSSLHHQEAEIFRKTMYFDDFVKRFAWKIRRRFSQERTVHNVLGSLGSVIDTDLPKYYCSPPPSSNKQPFQLVVSEAFAFHPGRGFPLCLIACCISTLDMLVYRSSKEEHPGPFGASRFEESDQIAMQRQIRTCQANHLFNGRLFNLHEELPRRFIC